MDRRHKKRKKKNVWVQLKRRLKPLKIEVFVVIEFSWMVKLSDRIVVFFSCSSKRPVKLTELQRLVRRRARVCWNHKLTWPPTPLWLMCWLLLPRPIQVGLTPEKSFSFLQTIKGLTGCKLRHSLGPDTIDCGPYCTFNLRIWSHSIISRLLTLLLI